MYLYFHIPLYNMLNSCDAIHVQDCPTTPTTPMDPVPVTSQTVTVILFLTSVTNSGHSVNEE